MPPLFAVELAVTVAEGEDPDSMLATTFHYAATRRITEIGLLIAVGLAAALVALHFGVSPYRHGR